jgi:hypothetical protein
MQKTLALIFLALTLALASRAEENHIVKIFTLKNGKSYEALRSIEMTADGKTTYVVTQRNGQKVTFDSSEVASIKESSVSFSELPAAFTLEKTGVAQVWPEMAQTARAEAAAAEPPTEYYSPVERYTGPSLGFQNDEPHHRNHAWHYGPYYYGLYGHWYWHRYGVLGYGMRQIYWGNGQMQYTGAAYPVLGVSVSTAYDSNHSPLSMYNAAISQYHPTCNHTTYSTPQASTYSYSHQAPVTHFSYHQPSNVYTSYHYSVYTRPAHSSASTGASTSSGSVHSFSSSGGASGTRGSPLKR